MRTLLFTWIHKLVCRFPILVSLVSILAAAGLGTYGALNMDLVTDQDRLISEDLDYHKRYMDFIRRFGDLEFLYVFIEGQSREAMTEYAESLESRLRDNPDIQTVLYRFPTEWLEPYRLYYASTEELAELSNELQQNRDDIATLYDTHDIHEILEQITAGIQQPMNGSGSDSAQNERGLQELLAAMQGTYESPFEAFYTMQEEMDAQLPDTYEYLWSEQGNALLMLVMPQKDFSTLSVIEEPLAYIRTAIGATNAEYTGRAHAGLTGRPALQADEMSTTNTDMMRASLIALVGVTILFTLFFREIVRPVLAILSLLMAMGWTYGVVALTLGHLNLLSTVFALVLIGLGVDFGIHLLHRYQEELKRLGKPEGAVFEALNRVGRGILTGAMTSSIAFLLALFTDFLGLAELGYVAGVGILLCLVAMLITLPALLLVYDRNLRHSNHLPTPVHLSALHYPSRFPRVIILLIIVISVIGYPRALEVRFDDNLLNLQAEGLESVEYEHKLLEQSEYSTWYCAFTRPDLSSVHNLVDTLNEEPTVAKTESLADILPRITPEKRNRFSTLREQLAPATDSQPVPYRPEPLVVREAWTTLDQLFLQVDSMPSEGASAASDNLTPEQIEALPEAQRRQLEAMQGSATPAMDEERLEALRELYELLSRSEEEINTMLERAHLALLENPRDILRTLARWVATPPPETDDLPQEYQTMYVGDDGSLLVMVFPRENIWEREAMGEFVSAMRSIDPEVTGTPIQVYESSQLMRDAFQFIGLLSIAVVAILVFLDFLRPSALLFVVVPLLIGVFWLLQLMGQFDIHLNLANFFAIPILIGIGVDNAVHFYHRFLETRNVRTTMTTTGTTLTLTTLTTIAGFGSLMTAAHKGLASMGALMTLGTATCWFACVIFLSAVLKLVYARTNQS